MTINVPATKMMDTTIEVAGNPMKKRGYSVNNKHSIRPVGRKPIGSVFVAIVLASLLSACATGLTVRSDIDPTVDFSQYNSFNFFEPMGIEGGYNSPIFGEHFRAAISGELRRRRYLTADNPD